MGQSNVLRLNLDLQFVTKGQSQICPHSVLKDHLMRVLTEYFYLLSNYLCLILFMKGTCV